ncbi:MAG: succinyl-diaminopimelate desuccinylase [Alphaproteobacteria bacterium]|nr:MAG: succinyl-diaminopimelate desuccinylase [Alphaproteobacteria bacterium]
MASIDPIELSQSLMRCESVTPLDAGALDVLQSALEGLGFVCQRHVFSEDGTPDVDNLYARLGLGAPNICFAGHTDVVPVGDADAWTVDPFGAKIKDGILYGRGAVDMKPSIAAFVAAASRLAGERDTINGSISFLITGDEEGPAINGTKKLLQVITDQGEVLDDCIVGEPTNPTSLGEMAKIGRRGSINGQLRVDGVQGHAAYPENADNPVPKILRLLKVLDALALDNGNDHFQPSNLEITTIDVGNEAQNVIPAHATAKFNVRFNSEHSGESIEALLRRALTETNIAYHLDLQVTGESFLCPPGRLSDLMVGAVEKVLGVTPELSTTGGTSDARFIHNYCNLVEFGLINDMAHKVDEHIAVDDVHALGDIYLEVLRNYFD